MIESRSGVTIVPSKASEASDRLNRELFDLNILYDQFANEFNLGEIKLNILKCAGLYC